MRWKCLTNTVSAMAKSKTNHDVHAALVWYILSNYVASIVYNITEAEHGVLGFRFASVQWEWVLRVDYPHWCSWYGAQYGACRWPTSERPKNLRAVSLCVLCVMTYLCIFLTRENQWNTENSCTFHEGKQKLAAGTVRNTNGSLYKSVIVFHLFIQSDFQLGVFCVMFGSTLDFWQLL